MDRIQTKSEQYIEELGRKGTKQRQLHNEEIEILQAKLLEATSQGEQLRDQNLSLMEDLSSSKHGDKKLKDLKRTLEFQVDELMQQLEQSDNARKDVKVQLNSATNQIIELEEQLYESRTTQKEILDELQIAEDKLQT